MEEAIQPERLKCVCGAKLKMPPVVPVKISAGKCPNCNAPFQYRDGAWRCIAEPPTTEVPSPRPDVPEIPPSEEAASTTPATLPGVQAHTAEAAPSESERETGEVRSNVLASTPPAEDTGDKAQVSPAVDKRLEQPEPNLPTPSFTTSSIPQPNDDAGDVSNDSLPANRFNNVAAVDSVANDAQPRHQSAIRQAIVETVRVRNGVDPAVLSALALACHPWPDEIVSKNVTNAIAAELLPSFNINHPSLFEVAIDRLLRFAETVEFEQATELATKFKDAADLLQHSRLQNTSAVDAERPRNCLVIQSPWGIPVPQAYQTHEEQLAEDPTDLTVNDTWTPLITELLNAAIVQRSGDIGVLCGGEATDTTVENLAKHFGVELPTKIFDDYLRGLDTRSRDILMTRTFNLHSPETLVEVAARWGVTRERVRQIEVRAKERLVAAFEKPFTKFGYRTILPLTHRIVSSEDLYSAAIAVASNSDFRDCLAGFVLDLFGPWQSVGSWAHHTALDERVANLRQRLSRGADKYGFLESELIQDACGTLFKNPSERDRFLTDEVGLGHYFEQWTLRNTLRSQVAAAFKKIGRPATKEEIGDLLGHPRVGSIFGNMPEIIRADRFRWGFKEWIEDAYEGIVGEIEQRIEEYNGSVPLQLLLREIPTRFDVAESSVKAYIYSDAFVVENDMVRLANIEDYSPRSPRLLSDAVEINGRWGYRSRIFDRHFNGYSLGVNFDVAFANGLRPGDDLVVPIEGHDEEVSLIWRSHSINRLVDVGRVANFLLSQGYQAGEEVVIIPSQTSVQMIPAKSLGLEDEHASGNGQRNRDISDDDNSASTNDPLFELLGD